MSDKPRPPPLLPFDPANDVPTEPGIGIVSPKQENARLRRERDEARDALAATASGDTADSEPPPTRPSERVRRAAKARAAALFTGKWVLLPPLLLILARYAQKRWPQFADLIDWAMQVLPQ